MVKSQGSEAHTQAHALEKTQGSIPKGWTVAQVLSYCTVVAGTLYKLPQVLKIQRARSAKGIALKGVLLDTWCCAAEAAYSFANGQPFADWGEVPAQFLCSAFISLQILYYENKIQLPSIVTLGGFLVTHQVSLMHLPRILGQNVGLKVLSTLKTLNMAIILLSKIPQILLNHSRKATGELSPSTVGIGCLGSIVRFYTLAMSVNGVDPLMLANQGTSLALNSTILLQIFLYFKES